MRTNSLKRALAGGACALAAVWAAAAALPPSVDAGGAGSGPAPVGMAQWQAMSPEQRRDLRARYAAWQALPPAERQRVRAAAVQVQALDPAARHALRARFDALDRLHREGWQLGPELGGDWAGLQPLFGFVPVAQREVLLGLLHGLAPAQRSELVRLAARTPPHERAALREALLAVPPGERDAWLASHARR